MALSTEAAVQQVRRHQHRRSGDAENDLFHSPKCLAGPCNDEDQRDSSADQRQQRFAAMQAIAGDEGHGSQQQDANGQGAVDPCIAGKIRDDAGEEAEEDWCQKTVNQAKARCRRARHIGVRVQTSLRGK